jgi:hypothetical protein
VSDFPAEEFHLDGEPGAIKGSARQWSQFGSAATDAATEIRSLDSSLFIGPEGDQYRDGLNDKLPPHLDVTGQAYSKVGAALSSYADALTGLQGRMSPLRVRAPGLWDALQQAKGRVGAAQAADRQHEQQRESDARSRPPDQPAPPDTYRSDLGAATASLSAAQQAWDDCLNAARAVKSDLHVAIDAADRAIRDAADTRFAHNPHGWGALVAGFKNFVSDHVQGLAKLSGVLKLVSGIAGVLSFIPVIGEAALAVSLVTAGAALAIDASIKFATGKGSWTSIVVDGALLALPFGIGKGMEVLRGARGAESLAVVAEEGSEARRVLELGYKPGWTAAQRAEADMKVGQLDDLAQDGNLLKSEPQRSPSNLRDQFKDHFGLDELPADKDVDHIHDLQLGGADDVATNTQLLDSSVNRSLGKQIDHRIAGDDLGTQYHGVTIHDR